MINTQNNAPVTATLTFVALPLALAACGARVESDTETDRGGQTLTYEPTSVDGRTATNAGDSYSKTGETESTRVAVEREPAERNASAEGILRVVPLDVPEEFLVALRNSERGDALDVPFVDIPSLRAVTRKVYRSPYGIGWLGEIAGLTIGTVTLTLTENNLSGTLRLNRHTFKIHTEQHGRYVLSELDPSYGAGRCGIPGSGPARDEAVAAVDDEPFGSEPTYPKGGTWQAGELTLDTLDFEFKDFITDKGYPGVLVPDSKRVIQVMTLFTPRAKAWALKFKDSLEAYSLHQLVETNVALLLNDIGTELELDGAFEIGHQELDPSLVDDLKALTTGAIPGVDILRDLRRADLVTLFVDNEGSDVSGISQGFTAVAVPGADPTPNDGRGLFQSSGFNIVDIRSLHRMDYVLTHQIAHNLGAGHADGSQGAASYARGAVAWPFRTLGTEASDCPTCEVQLGTISSPTASINNVPLGSASMDNRRMMLEARWTVANYRNSNLVQ